jgi:urea transport system permease protein
VNALKSWATRAYPDLWLIILGGSFVLVVLFMPKGIVGLPSQITGISRIRRRSAARAADSSAPEIPSPEPIDP